MKFRLPIQVHRSFYDVASAHFSETPATWASYLFLKNIKISPPTGPCTCFSFCQNPSSPGHLHAWLLITSHVSLGSVVSSLKTSPWPPNLKSLPVTLAIHFVLFFLNYLVYLFICESTVSLPCPAPTSPVKDNLCECWDLICLINCCYPMDWNSTCPIIGNH